MFLNCYSANDCGIIKSRRQDLDKSSVSGELVSQAGNLRILKPKIAT